MNYDRPQKVHMFKNQAGRTQRGSKRPVDNTACASNHGDLTLKVTDDPRQVTCKRCLKAMGEPNPLEAHLLELQEDLRIYEVGHARLLDQATRLKDGLRIAVDHVGDNVHVLLMPNCQALTLGSLFNLLLAEEFPDL